MRWQPVNTLRRRQPLRDYERPRHRRPCGPRKVNAKLTPVLEEIILHADGARPQAPLPVGHGMKRELDDYESVELTSRHTRLQAPQIWKSRFRMLPLNLGLGCSMDTWFLIMFLYFRKH